MENRNGSHIRFLAGVLCPKPGRGLLTHSFPIIVGIIILAPMATIVKMWALGIFVGAIFLDALHIMTQLQSHHDERQNYHHLIIEKNVSFAAACAVIGGILFQTYQNRDILGTDHLPFDISLGIVLGIMLIVKVLSTLYVRAKL